MLQLLILHCIDLCRQIQVTIKRIDVYILCVSVVNLRDGGGEPGPLIGSIMHKVIKNDTFTQLMCSNDDEMMMYQMHVYF